MITEGLHNQNSDVRTKCIPCENGGNGEENLFKSMVPIMPGWRIGQKKPVCYCLLMMPPVKSWQLNLWNMRVIGPIHGLCKRYFRQHGLPEAFYADRFSVFRVNQTNVTTTDAQTHVRKSDERTGHRIDLCLSLPRQKDAWNVPIRHSRIAWSRKCAWLGSMIIKGECLSSGLYPIYNHKFAVQPQVRLTAMNLSDLKTTSI